MVSWLLKILAALLGIYAIIPTLLARFGHVGVIWRTAPGLGGVALTFDDGPDPVYTPQVLDVLQTYGARACFFVLGEKASRYPDLVDRLLAEGHEVANHGYTHRPYWFLGPGGTLREVEQGSRVIEQVTGRRPRLFRPPWGIFNACTLWPRYLLGQRVVLWSFMSQDWWQKQSPEDIARLVLRRIRDGSILIFHDSAGPLADPGSPAKMLAALPLILAGLQKKGLTVINMDEMVDYNPPSLSLRFIRSVWGIWEKAFEKLAGVSDPGGPDCLYRLAVRKYGGKPRVLADGTRLVRGDLLAELHMKNDRIMALTAGAQAEKSAVILVRESQNSLPHLAAVLQNNPRFRDVKALVGYTMMHRGVKRIGFSSYELPRAMRTAIALYEWWLMILYHHDGWAHVRRYRRKLIPKLVIISREKLLADQGLAGRRNGEDTASVQADMHG
ncbi:MAG: polysaccharide deacetylase family protein [Peptococcaceae bacterium]|jgi:peptidoglycan/xylan/chitin deacetylase (PgdA/CDA1 family)|nr:polysaccharide deacetylase family protein [Peptococcaceae bacterium]